MEKETLDNLGEVYLSEISRMRKGDICHYKLTVEDSSDTIPAFAVQDLPQSKVNEYKIIYFEFDDSNNGEFLSNNPDIRE